MKDNFLQDLFDSKIRIRILGFIIQNYAKPLTIKDVASYTKIKSKKIKSELSKLVRLNFIKKKSAKIFGKKQELYFVNENIPLFNELKTLFYKTAPLLSDNIAQKARMVGKLKLLILSGVFLNVFDSRVDLLLVGDKISDQKVDKLVSEIEKQLGKEIKCLALNTNDFIYRLNMFDGLLKDIFEKPNKKIIDKLNFKL